MRPNESDHNQPSFDPNSWPWGPTQPNLTLFLTLRGPSRPKIVFELDSFVLIKHTFGLNPFWGRPNLTLFQPRGPNPPDWTQKLVRVWSHYIGRIPTVQPNYNWFRRPCYMKEWLLKMYDLWFHGRNAGQSVPKIGCKLIGGFDFKPKPLGGRCRDH